MAIVGAGGAGPAGRAVRGGADLVQVRAKELSAGQLMVLVRDVVAEVGDAGAVIVNSRPDIAERSGAGGVHLPEAGLSLPAVRRFFPALSVSVSCHGPDALRRAAAQGADFAILGPAFETPGKEGRALGVDAVRAMLAGLALPVIAVGGVVPGNCRSLILAGARGVAAIRPFSNASDALPSSVSYRRALDRVTED
jgi:thiamine-phosphate diphosphorylase